MLYTAGSSLFSHWRRHPGQLFVLLVGLALATALWSGVQAINAEARSAYDSAAETLGQDQLSRLVTADGRPVPTSEFIALRRAGYLVSPVISGVLREDGSRLRLLGFDPLTAPDAGQAPALEGGAELDLLSFFTAPGVLLMSERTAAGSLPDGLPPITLSPGVPPEAAITDIATAARLLGQTDPTYLSVAPEQPLGLPPLTDATDLVLQAPQTGSDVARLTDSFHLNLTAFAFLAFAVGLFIVHSAVGLAFEQRRSTLRTLRALGVSLRLAVTALALELLVLALIAGAIGLVLGYLLAGALMPGVAGTLRGLYGADVPGVLRFDPEWAALGLAMTLSGAFVAAAQALTRIARMPLLTPAKPRAWAQVSLRSMRLQAVAAGGLLLLAVAFVALGDGLIAGFATLAALLLGAALGLPPLLTLLLRAGRSFARRPVTEWLWADTRQQLPGLSLALMALLLALAANIGVSTMVGSFRGTFLGWLDQRLAAEIYVTTASPEEARRFEAFAAPITDAVLPVVSAEARLAGQPGEVFGMADHATFRDNWPLLEATPDAWDRLADGTGILINEQLFYREDLSLDHMLEPVSGTTLEIVGIYSDYGNPAAQAIIGVGLFQELYPDIPVTRFALRVPYAEVPAVVASLREDFGLPTDAVINQAQIKAFSLDVFERTFLITGALNVLTLAVAGFALLATLLTLSAMRLPQLAPVWALGVTRRDLALLDLARTVGLAALTFFVAIPVGLVLAWVLLAVVNVEAFGWRLPMQLFPADWGMLLLLALTAAALAGALPALRLARTAPVTWLAVFSHDR